VSNEHHARKFAALLVADVAGYSRLMGQDEEGTHGHLREHRRALLEPSLVRHQGQVVENTGDGMLVQFASAVHAVRCAIEIQSLMRERNAELPLEARIEFRIGIHVGDVIVDDDDIYGNDVNVAARLEALAKPGGVCARRSPATRAGDWSTLRGRNSVTRASMRRAAVEATVTLPPTVLRRCSRLGPLPGTVHSCIRRK
jgi:class 3 adenylate cyclase